MIQLAVMIYGEPKGTPRTKARVIGGHAGVYTPKTADDWKGDVMRAVEGKGFKSERDEPVRAEMEFLFRRPASHIGKRGVKPSAPRQYTKKPDADNLAKAVLDALVNVGVIFDDAAVVDLRVTKHWASDEEGPGCFLSLQTVEAEE